MNHFQSLPSYENFIYSIANQYASVVSSTLVVMRRGAKRAIISGEVFFADAYRLSLRELVDFADDQVVVKHYSYEVWHGQKKLYWYDSQPHPNNPDLALNHPHHKHIPPDIKHNHRIPAPELSFNKPNLPFLIGEVEQTFLT